jgi:hypothetical protein
MSTEAENMPNRPQNASWRDCGHADEVAALTARLAAVEAERDAACQQVALLRRLIHQHGITWFDPPKVTIDRLQAERDALTEHLLHRHGCDFGLAHAPVADADEEPPDGR